MVTGVDWSKENAPIDAGRIPEQAVVSLIGEQKERVGIDVALTLPATFYIGVGDHDFRTISYIEMVSLSPRDILPKDRVENGDRRTNTAVDPTSFKSVCFVSYDDIAINMW
jgi:hypothetical protein